MVAVSLIALPLGLSCGLLILYAAVLEPIVRASISLSLGLRIALAFALLAPLGACLGCAMPLGLSRLSDRGSGAVAYAWGVNGFASVVASVAGIFIAIHFGLSRAMLAGAACYAIALGWAQLTSTRPPDGSPDERRS